MAMVVRAAISRSFQSARHALRHGFQHFWHAPHEGHGGDLVFVQGHSAPGIYARAFLEGRLTEEQLLNFRQEVGRQGAVVLSASLADAGLLAVPHRVDGPRAADGDLPGALPQVSARIAGSPTRPTARSGCSAATARWTSRKAWAPSVSRAREKLDNLIFVDQLQPAAPRWPGARQRQDHPGAGGRFPRRGLERDQGDLGLGLGRAAGPRHARHPAQVMEECVDGEYQDFKSKTAPTCASISSASIPRRRRWWRDWSDDEIWSPDRGGHDPHKVYAAFRKAARSTQGQPTVILAKTVKGYGMGAGGRRPDDRPSAEEAGPRRSASSATASTCPFRRGARSAALLTSRREDEPEMRTARAPRERWAAICRSGAAKPTSSSSAAEAVGASRPCSRPHGRGTRDLDHAWPSCASSPR
jgi:pyruvate dehydrogenase E1 component